MFPFHTFKILTLLSQSSTGGSGCTNSSVKVNKLLPLMSNVLIMKEDKKLKKGEGDEVRTHLQIEDLVFGEGGISGGTNGVVGHMGLMVRRQYLIFLFQPTIKRVSSLLHLYQLFFTGCQHSSVRGRK